MPTQVIGKPVEVPLPFAILMEFAYFVLIALGVLGSSITAGCLIWKFLGGGRLISSSTFVQKASDIESYEDEMSCEDYTGLEFENDTDEEYMRRPY